MNKQFRTGQKVRGFSLVELMVAMVLGLLLVAGILQLFLGSRQTYATNEGLARLQESVRFSVEEIKTTVRGSAHFGFCGTRPDPTSHLAVAAGWQQAVFGPQNGLIGWEFSGTGLTQQYTIEDDYPVGAPGNWSAAPRQADGTTPDLALPPVLTASTIQPIAGSDVIIVRQLIPIPDVAVSGTPGDTAFSFQLNGPHGLDRGDLVLITDCTNADLFRHNADGDDVLSRDDGGACGECPGNRNPNNITWQSLLGPTLQVYRVRTTAFYVGRGAGEPGLYRMELAGCPCGVAEELVEGVENMQVLYGYSLPGSQGGDGKTVEVGRWLRADQFNDWWPIIGVRLGLLYRSPDRIGTQNVQREFNLAGAYVTHPEDANLRHDASATLALRNRVIFDD